MIERIAGETQPLYDVRKSWGPRYDQVLKRFEELLEKRDTWQGQSLANRMGNQNITEFNINRFSHQSNMRAFLEKLAFHLCEKFPDNLGNQCIVFPNRCAGVFFRHYLQEALPRSGWLRRVYTINGYLGELSGMDYADPIDVSFELYKVYLTLVPEPEPYDEFYYWGEMMISDFNDIDKYLVNAEDLFLNMADLKEIDNVFDYLSPEQKALIIHFWSHFNEKKLSPEQRSFIGIWKILHPLSRACVRYCRSENGIRGHDLPGGGRTHRSAGVP